MSEASQSILPGSRIGVFGGGQLGRMFCHAAQRMGYQVIVFSPEFDAPAHQVVARSINASYDDLDQVAQFAKSVDVITLEFENIPAKTVEQAGQWCPVRPGAAILTMAQHRIREKSLLRDRGFPVTPFVEVASEDEADRIDETLQWPVIMKTAMFGYDGKGQRKVANASEFASCYREFRTPLSSVASGSSNRPMEVIAEKTISLACEISAIVARNPRGEVAVFPVMLNEHAHHILDVSQCPVPARWNHVARQAEAIACELARSFELEGLLCIEFFVDSDGNLMINELAPRTHNSGHLTIEACATSQFEQQVRAVCNLPLGSTQLRCGGAAMANLLGDVWTPHEPRWEKVLCFPNTALHLYGKAEAKKGRKMGHLTHCASTPEEAAHAVRTMRGLL